MAHPCCIAVISQKGGTGKTTTVLNLAVAANRSGKRVLIADLDPQASATGWFALRPKVENPTFFVQPTHPAGLDAVKMSGEAQGIDWLLFDTAAGTDTTAVQAVKSAHLVLITCRPSMFDRNAMANSVRLCLMEKRVPLVLLTQTDPQGTETAEIRAELSRVPLDEAGERRLPVLTCEVGRRKAFFRSLNTGEAVLEYEPNGKAALDVLSLYRSILAMIPEYQDSKVSATISQQRRSATP